MANLRNGLIKEMAPFKDDFMSRKIVFIFLRDISFLLYML